MKAGNGWRLVIPHGAMALAGCVVAPDYVVEAPTPAAVVVPGPPPPPLALVSPPAPAVGMVWIGGDWFWLNRWVWRPGRWAYPPHPYARWIPGRWWLHGPRWDWGLGRWVRR